MLWDQAIVRNTYKLRPDPKSFVSYQRFGWKLLHHVTRSKGINALAQLEKDHERSAGYFEPMTMILDHLAFSPKLSAIALSALGGPSKAFSHDLSVGVSLKLGATVLVEIRPALLDISN